MKLLFVSSNFPNAVNATLGCFNEALVRALARSHDVDVVCPIAWTSLLKGRRHGVRVPLYRRMTDPAGFGVHYVPFFYTPKAPAALVR